MIGVGQLRTNTAADAPAVTQPATSIDTPIPSIGTPATATPSDNTPVTPAASGYTAAQVAQHASATSCYAIVGSSVYDLTQWINQHPGGSRAILGLCGKDGTAAFTRQHGGQAQAEAALSSLRIGALTK